MISGFLLPCIHICCAGTSSRCLWAIGQLVIEEIDFTILFILEITVFACNNQHCISSWSFQMLQLHITWAIVQVHNLPLLIQTWGLGTDWFSYICYQNTDTLLSVQSFETHSLLAIANCFPCIWHVQATKKSLWVHRVHPRVNLFPFFSVVKADLVILFFSLADNPSNEIYGTVFSGTGLPLCHRVMM